MGSTLIFRAPNINCPVSGTETYCVIPSDGVGTDIYIYADKDGMLVWSEDVPAPSAVYGDRSVTRCPVSSPANRWCSAAPSGGPRRPVAASST